jgi:hypothetical protein
VPHSALTWEPSAPRGSEREASPALARRLASPDG